MITVDEVLGLLKLNFGTKVLSVIFAFAIVILANRAIMAIFDKKLIKNEKLNATLVRYLKPLLRVLITVLGALFIINSLGYNTTSFVALFSILSAAFALSAQSLLGNMFGGFALLTTHPFVVGDEIKVGEVEGIVDSIGLVYTVLISPDFKRITIPNGALSSATIVNASSAGKRRVDIELNISYDNKLDDVKNAFVEAIGKTKCILPDENAIRIMKYGNTYITYSVRVWCRAKKYWDVFFELNENIKQSFDKNGIVHAYDSIVVNRKPGEKTEEIF